MKQLFAVAACAAVLAGCNHTAPRTAETFTPYTLSRAENAVIDSALRSALKDPASAIFGARYAASSSAGGVYVCGYINAKNSFGGYTGDRPFSGVLGPKPATVFFVSGISNTDAQIFAKRDVCSGYGITL